MSQTLLNNRSRLEEEIGHGGMGTVHRAFDTTLERELAVKLVTGSRWIRKGELG